MDHDITLEDIQAASFRLSWPQPAPRRATARPVRRLFSRVVRVCRRETLHGWPVELSAPAG